MIHNYKTTQTPSGGTISWNTDDIKGRSIQLSVKPATATTTYDISITDDNSIVIYSKTGLKGTLNDNTPIGFYGVHTVAITNASVNEAFKFSLKFEELR